MSGIGATRLGVPVDVLIIGGGPAGLATGLACRRQGLSVRVIEPSAPGRDKPCGEGLMPDAVACLERLGVDLSDAGRVFRGIRYCDRESDVRGTFPDGPGIGVRRTVLHQRLFEASRSAGVEVVRGRVEGLERRGSGRGEWAARWNGGLLEARVLIGADGLRSACRGWAGLGVPGLGDSGLGDSGLAGSGASRRRRFGVRRHFVVPAWGDRVEVHWHAGVEAYVTPVESDLVGVAILWTDPPVAGPSASAGKPVFDHLLARFPRLVEQLASSSPASPAAGCGPLAQRARGSVSENLALVGDAAGYLDAITGEGMAVAFAEAEAVAAAIRDGDLARYQRERRRIVRRPEIITRLALLLSRRPALRGRALRAFAAEPALFDRVLALHVGAQKSGEVRLAAAFLARLLAPAR
ncbi:MAG TPA: NAD(P)/FAD-dependent oxidoreductase [Thermoanaerobaculia bacterium]|nr:NAD(P)/FAD-dependent oxidoreductase [Thermoanaerobaculia bacterium]